MCCVCLARSLQIKERCRKGIPSSLRHQAWLRLSGAHRAREQQPDRFEVCVCVCVCVRARAGSKGRPIHASNSHSVERVCVGFTLQSLQRFPDNSYISDIEKDLSRTFPHHELFAGKGSQG